MRSGEEEGGRRKEEGRRKKEEGRRRSRATNKISNNPHLAGGEKNMLATQTHVSACQIYMPGGPTHFNYDIIFHNVGKGRINHPLNHHQWLVQSIKHQDMGGL